MPSRRIRFTVCAGLVALTAGFAVPAHAQPAIARPAAATIVRSENAPAVFGRAAYLLDASTDKVLFSKKAAVRMPVASLAKVMTAYLVLQEADLADKVRIKRQDVEYADDNDGTSAGLRAGDRLTVEELLYALMLPSGADAAHALARTYGPGVDRFTAKMNAAARRLGLLDTTYRNADGLPTPRGQGLSTARDQARLAEIALRDPTLEKITATRRYSIRRTDDHRAYTWVNTNELLGAPGVIGVKTGFTRAAGFCLAFAADRDGHRLVGVILGEELSGRRFRTARALLNWAADRVTTTGPDARR